MHGANTLKARNFWAEEEDRILRSEFVKQGTMTCSETVAPLSRLDAFWNKSTGLTWLIAIMGLQHRNWESLETGEQSQRSCPGEVTKVRHRLPSFGYVF